MTGTSMASPYVAGVAGLMLSLNPQLTAAQIGGIIQRTSRPLPGVGYDWQTVRGFGVIDAAQPASGRSCASASRSGPDRSEKRS